MDLPQTIEENEVHRGWLRIVKRRLRHVNGGIQEYEIVNPNTHSVCALVLDINGDVVLIELYRFGQHRRPMELPAGAVEEGESLVQAIAREILEETGYEGTLTEIGKHFIAAEHGVTRHVFVSQNSKQVAQPTPEQSEIDEGAQVKILTIEDFKRLVRSGMLTETGAAFMALDHLDLL